jgi:hypothetical protein
VASAGEPRRYTFNPLERRGVLVGFGASQLAVLVVGCVVALGILGSAPTPAGMVVATAIMAAAGAAGCWSVSGRSPAGWAPIVVAWVGRRLARSHSSPQPLAGHRVANGPASLTAGGPPPPSLAGVRILASPEVPGAGPMAIVNDRKAGTYAAVLAVRGRSISLLDPTEKQQRLAAWGAALAAMGREGSPVHRLQWIERTVPGDSDGLRRYLGDSGGGDGAARESYSRLVEASGPATQDHEVLLVLAVHGRRAAKGVWGLLGREIRLLQGQLRAADVVVDRLLGEPEVAHAMRVAVDPDARAARVRPGWRLAHGWPVAADEGWSRYRTDGAWHATYWVAEWPRVEVGADFLTPLLLGPGGRRAVAVTMAPVGPSRAARQVEAAKTADLADEELRRRAGFVATARRRREAEGVLRRETELADGHAEFRFSGYVTVSAGDQASLDTACAEVEQTASQAHLELRRLYGQQEEAFTWTLPLARGLA